LYAFRADILQGIPIEIRNSKIPRFQGVVSEVIVKLDSECSPYDLLRRK